MAEDDVDISELFSGGGDDDDDMLYIDMQTVLEALDGGDDCNPQEVGSSKVRVYSWIQVVGIGSKLLSTKV
ncbi:hypothetical protein CR513_27034, partial [Mucuna pruriens]